MLWLYVSKLGKFLKKFYRDMDYNRNLSNKALKFLRDRWYQECGQYGHDYNWGNSGEKPYWIDVINYEDLPGNLPRDKDVWIDEVIDKDGEKVIIAYAYLADEDGYYYRISLDRLNNKV
ncbi:MAG: hypothetical protein GY861_22510 [bacterium]|nr:hypothetical protein [bacterium]